MSQSEEMPPRVETVEQAGVSTLPRSDREERPAQGPFSAAAAPATREADAGAWRDQSLRLRAEMDNFRRRQQRLTEERVAEERERLISQFATVADDLERALESGDSSLAGLRQGVALTHQAWMRLLAREGVESIRPTGEMFDPRWHEAVSTVPYGAIGVRPDTVVEVVRDGYRIGDRLVRPARVIVAV